MCSNNNKLQIYQLIHVLGFKHRMSVKFSLRVNLILSVFRGKLMVYGNSQILALTPAMKLLHCFSLVMYTKSTGRQLKGVLWLFLMHPFYLQKR